MRLERPAGDVWVSLLSVTGARDRPQTLIDVVETRPMETGRIVFIDAAAMDRAIAATGRVALYGISFDTDRADPRPDSRPTIEEIAKYLRANPGVSVVVTGHTDSQGAFDHNVDLSRRRAAAVVAALTRDFGIAAARLTAFGAGMAAPVAANDNDQGRAQNRRVEIVRR
jgi:outer membrane protein OmpA-like peptidoglycan-associated protein